MLDHGILIMTGSFSFLSPYTREEKTFGHCGNRTQRSRHYKPMHLYLGLSSESRTCHNAGTKADLVPRGQEVMGSIPSGTTSFISRSIYPKIKYDYASEEYGWIKLEPRFFYQIWNRRRKDAATWRAPVIDRILETLKVVAPNFLTTFAKIGPLVTRRTRQEKFPGELKTVSTAVQKIASLKDW